MWDPCAGEGRLPRRYYQALRYGPEVDMWSAGCIIAEMATGQATFPGDSEIGTVFKIFKTIGTGIIASLLSAHAGPCIGLLDLQEVNI